MILVVIAYASGEASDKPVQMANLARAFAPHIHTVGLCKNLILKRQIHQKSSVLSSAEMFWSPLDQDQTWVHNVCLYSYT